MSPALQPRVFAPAPPRPTLILARGEKAWRLQVRPWVLGASVAALALVAIGAAGSIALFLMSDDVASAFLAREARTVSAYEQRIADLRRDLDGATSREHADRRTIVAKVETMLDRQREIEVRYERMMPLLEEAHLRGVIPADVPIPSQRPGDHDVPFNAFAPEQRIHTDAFDGFDLRVELENDRWPTGAGDPAKPAAVEAIGTEILSAVAAKVRTVEASQLEQLTRLADAAQARAFEVAVILGDAGVATGEAAGGMGGPFIPVFSDDPFSDSLDRLSDALSELRGAQATAARVPLGAPIEGARLSSNFGIRADPFIRRRALHAGVDYAASTGTEVHASAAGTVLRAGRRGGYGLMVEIDHGQGHVTRYGHLSAIDVEDGQAIEAGEILGRVGSTGRSTGPHLHYEVRRAGKAVDPMDYLGAGEKLDALL